MQPLLRHQSEWRSTVPRMRWCCGPKPKGTCSSLEIFLLSSACQEQAVSLSASTWASHLSDATPDTLLYTDHKTCKHFLGEKGQSKHFTSVLWLLTTLRLHSINTVPTDQCIKLPKNILKLYFKRAEKNKPGSSEVGTTARSNRNIPEHIGKASKTEGLHTQTAKQYSEKVC